MRVKGEEGQGDRGPRNRDDVDKVRKQKPF